MLFFFQLKGPIHGEASELITQSSDRFDFIHSGLYDYAFTLFIFLCLEHDQGTAQKMVRYNRMKNLQLMDTKHCLDTGITGICRRVKKISSLFSC